MERMLFYLLGVRKEGFYWQDCHSSTAHQCKALFWNIKCIARLWAFFEGIGSSEPAVLMLAHDCLS